MVLLIPIKSYGNLDHSVAVMGMERLRLLFCYCNVVGLFPFRMVINKDTNEFKRFDNQWRHPSNWWFATLLIAQIVYIIWTIYWQIFLFLSESKLPTIYLFIYTLHLSDYVLMIAIPRIFLFHFRNLETALETLHQITRLLPKNSHTSCGINRRLVVGILASFLWVYSLNIILKIIQYSKL